MHLKQPLPFQALPEEILGVLNVTWFSNDARFHLDGYINKQYVRIWLSENLGIIVANQQHQRV
jgi:hypothetical protein